jgi:hypothetical protein
MRRSSDVDEITADEEPDPLSLIELGAWVAAGRPLAQPARGTVIRCRR